MEELIAKRYANALSSVSDDISSSLLVLNTLCEVVDTKEVNETLNSPLISNEQKTNMILSSIEGADNSLINFIKILGENRRLDLIPVITKVLNSGQQKLSNKYDGIVETASDLDEETLANLENSLKGYTGAVIKLKQEKSSRDGLKVSVDDLGIEVNFSKSRIKEQLIDFISKSL